MRFAAVATLGVAAKVLAPNDSRKGSAMSAELLRRNARRVCLGKDGINDGVFIGQFISV